MVDNKPLNTSPTEIPVHNPLKPSGYFMYHQV